MSDKAPDKLPSVEELKVLKRLRYADLMFTVFSLARLNLGGIPEAWSSPETWNENEEDLPTKQTPTQEQMTLRSICHQLGQALFMLPNAADAETCVGLARRVVDMLEEPVETLFQEAKEAAGLAGIEDSEDMREAIQAAEERLTWADPNFEGLSRLMLTPEWAWQYMAESKPKPIPDDMRPLAILINTESRVNPPDPSEVPKGIPFDPLKHYVGLATKEIIVGRINDDPSRVHVWFVRREDVKDPIMFVPNLCLTVGPPNARALAMQLLRHAEKAEADCVQFREECEEDGEWDRHKKYDPMNEAVKVRSNEGIVD